MTQKKYLYLIAIALLISACSTIENNRTSIPYSVEKYIYNNGTDFINYELSDLGINNDYKEHKRSYDVYDNIEKIWQDYMAADPIRSFTSRIITFGVLFNPENSTLYSSDIINSPPFSEGQIYILNLKFMGLIGVPVAFKMSKLDENKKMIEFIYMKNNIANGFQQIYFTSQTDSEGLPVTRIEHISFFKSDYSFQDRFIYPAFHKQTIDDFHQNIFTSNDLNWDIH